MNKTNIGFMVNNLEIGRFDCKEISEQQDKIANEIGNSNNVQLTPKIYKQALACAKRYECLKAIENELSNMRRHRGFNILPLLWNVKPIGGGWVFALKPATDDKPAHFKARNVAQGNSQLSGFNFHNTFALTETFTSLWILLMLAAQSGLHIATLDFVAAYLNTYIDKEICICPPEGLMVLMGSGCCLREALYSTKQAGQCCVYLNNDCGVIRWLQIDNGAVFAKKQTDITALRSSLCIKWDDMLHNIIGIDINHTNDGFHLGQEHLILSIINKYWDQQSLQKSPLPVKHNLTTLTNNDNVIRQPDFIAAVGALSFVATGMRPDISFALNLLARHSKFPGKDDWFCLQHLLGYLSGTSTWCLTLTPHGHTPVLEVYSDASLEGECLRMSHGFVRRLSGCSIVWCSKRLMTVALSSCHAEFMALGIAARHGKWIRNLTTEFMLKPLVINLKCNNTSCMKIATDCSPNKRMRHSDREFFITNQLLHEGCPTLEWFVSGNRLSDVLTKAMGPQLHLSFADKLLSC
ncbi:hypothetical protein O181_034983 [Austropuccinia psidii MF-1]|uniref:Reverse transcriptase Ty1/copia-type domain-containing protein n=1 Tax=Austropuccinia psidii MF-1 TaxID=1389203 RepID=A0A9Q3D6K4_9BASI|nr:hypothetical protein [Austropuccinia psidii MF-1]